MRLKKIGIVVMLLSICVMSSFVVSEAKVSNTKVHKAYSSKLKQIDKKWKKESLTGEGATYFAYYDINGDGIDECFVDFNGFNTEDNSVVSLGGTDVAVYTFYNGKVRKLVYSYTGGMGGTWGGIYFYKKSKYITYHDRAGWSDSVYTFKTIKKGKLVKMGTCEYHTVMENEKKNTTYKVNGKEVSEKKYNAYYKKMNGKKGLKMYKVTDSNLKKM